MNRYPGNPHGYSTGNPANRFARPPYIRRDGDRNYRPPYRSPYRSSFRRRGFITGYAPWLGLGYWNYPGSYGYDYDDSDAAAYSSAPPYYDGYDPQADPQSEEQSPDPQYDDQQPRPYYQPAPAASQQAPLPQSSITLIFKDGRPAEQIQNYVLSRDTISVWDQHPRQIPIDQLDLAATVKANREAGVDFRLPNAPGN